MPTGAVIDVHSISLFVYFTFYSFSLRIVTIRTIINHGYYTLFTLLSVPIATELNFRSVIRLINVSFRTIFEKINFLVEGLFLPYRKISIALLLLMVPNNMVILFTKCRKKQFTQFQIVHSQSATIQNVVFKIF